MAKSQTRERVSASQLEEGDNVVVHLNDRAKNQLGMPRFQATVVDTGFGDTIVFKPDPQIQDECETHSWYTDSGYIHGQHSGLGRYSDIGKVAYVEK